MKLLTQYVLPRLAFLLFLLTSGLSSGQVPATDKLYKLDRSATDVKIGEVTVTDVFYTEPASPKVVRKVAKAELWKVVFSDGSAEVFNEPKGDAVPQRQSTTARTRPTPATQSPQSTTRQEAPARPETPTRAEPVARQEAPARPAAAPAPANERPAYQSTGARSIIKYAPVSNFGYEHVLSDNRSIYGGISLYSVDAIYTRVTAIGLKAEYRFYNLGGNSSKAAPRGFWLAPTALLWNVRVRDIDVDFNESVFVAQLGGIAGYQWIIADKFSIEPALGLSLTAVGAGTNSILGGGLVPLFALRFGYVLK